MTFVRTLLVCSLAFLVGCAPAGLKTIPVSGKLTFGGAPAPSGTKIFFVPIETENGLPKIPGFAEVQADGTFQVNTEQAGKGLIPGRYAVNVESWSTPPTMQAPVGVSRVPVGFKTPEFTLKSDEKQGKFDLDIPAGS